MRRSCRHSTPCGLHSPVCSGHVLSRDGVPPWLLLSSSTELLCAIQRARIGARTNLAEMPAAIVITAAAINTAFQPPVAASTEATGTSNAAVPFAVYSVPAFAAAYLLPNVSAQIAGKIEKISPQNRKISAANVMNAYGF